MLQVKSVPVPACLQTYAKAPLSLHVMILISSMLLTGGVDSFGVCKRGKGAKNLACWT
jgi:hypothetical protein